MLQYHEQYRAITNSAMFTALNRSFLLSPRPSNFIAFKKTLSSKAHFCTVLTTATPNEKVPKYSASRSRNLFSRISPVRNDKDVLQVLDQWVAEGKKVHNLEFQRIIRDLRSRRRFSQALQISEWISSNHMFTLSPGYCAVRLDLIGVVHGWEAAEFYFNNLSDQEKNEKTYGALLNSYVREGLLMKTLLHIQKMKDKGYASSSLTYNNLMALYKKDGQLEKIPEVISEMKKNGVVPNNFSYRMCINSFGERSDLGGMEKLLEEIESQPHISIDWATYSIVAYQFIKANEKEKALTYMKKLEEKIHEDAMGYNHLISLYAHLGDKDEMLRLWNLQKIVCKKQINRDYITMVGSLVKLGEFETAEALIKHWDSTCRTYDFRVPNILLIGYCQKGLIEKAERMLRGIVTRGKKPTPNSWAIISAGYLNNNNLVKAFECMKEALDVIENNMRWIPKPTQVTNLLKWLGDEGEVEQVQAFVQSLRKVIPASKYMYDALIKASIRDGRDIGWILNSLKTDGILVDDETQKTHAGAVELYS